MHHLIEYNQVLRCTTNKGANIVHLSTLWMLLPMAHLFSLINRTLKMHHHRSIQSNGLGILFFPHNDYDVCVVVLGTIVCPNFSLCELLAYHNLNPNSWPRQGAWKGAGRKCNPGATFTFSKTWKSMREWAHTFPSGLSLWELESPWTLESSKSDWRNQNSLDWWFFYIVENLLRHRCLKWTCMIHLSTYNTSYGRNKGQESKWEFDSQPLKVGNHLELRVCKGSATYHSKGPILKILGLLTWES
jgi:hypothetical protein